MYFTHRVHEKDDATQTYLSLLVCETPENVRTTDRMLYGSADTVTFKTQTIPEGYNNLFDVEKASDKLNELLDLAHETLIGDPMTWYKHYTIPKKSGGERPIDEPCEALMIYLRKLEEVLRKEFFAMYHNSAYAYVKYRNTLKCINQHKDGNMFLKTDFHNFFGSTTLDLTMKILPKLYPFNIFCSSAKRTALLCEVLSYAFLNDGLPQGTPISPMLTNLIMIPFDYTLKYLCKVLRVTYTRYADDCLFSCKYQINGNDFKRMIVMKIYNTLKAFDYPYTLNNKKTRVGSIKGKNWNLGLMLNGSHNITIGHEAKRRFKADVYRLYMDYWKERIPLSWLNSFEGRYHYYRYIEPDYVDRITRRIQYKTRHWSTSVKGVLAFAKHNPGHE